ncbi:MAG TPA: hypothetical protein VMR65_01845 [Candidatus Sulfotelmatobacter sp.]|jgi:hypothetical protein|nr:hypothetical protein [Candidatus Sulfotelmatobacter sp.]
MHRLRGLTTVGIVCCLLAAKVVAREPDGRVAFRYEWSAPEEAGAAPELRLTLTLQTPLQAIRLGASVPPAAAVRLVSARRLEGSPLAGAVPGTWPSAGLALGDLPAGTTLVLDLAVDPPATGGGVLAFGLDALLGSVHVHEGVGVPVGTPGVAPVIRNGAAEFPAGRAERIP